MFLLEISYSQRDAFVNFQTVFLQEKLELCRTFGSWKNFGSY